MVEASKSSILDFIRTHAHVGRPKSKNDDTTGAGGQEQGGGPILSANEAQNGVTQHASNSTRGNSTPPSGDEKRSDNNQARGSPNASEEGVTSAAIVKRSIFQRIYTNCKEVLFSSPINILLVFVPIGIAVDNAGLNPIIVFSMNAIAIIPLAGLLSHATEAVASRLGDTIGALLNVTFGNAVELIIFIIALTKKEVNIVQASLVGSILSNLLLILGMCFLFGGLRYREQIYNSTVTQMSACLLSLSVVSLLLPTAFHAAFADSASEATNRAVLQVSRGTSIILLLVYILYLLFQLKSHAYMYESTPQHIIDEESHPGILTTMLESSSSSSDSSSSDSDTTSGSHTTAKRFRRALRRRTRRKSSASSKDNSSIPSALRAASNSNVSEAVVSPIESPSHLGGILSGDEADDDGAPRAAGRIHRRDFGDDGMLSPPVERKRSEGRSKKKKNKKVAVIEEPTEVSAAQPAIPEDVPPSPRVAFAAGALPSEDGMAARRQFNIRPLAAVPRPTMPKMLSQTVFSSNNPTGAVNTPVVRTVPRAPYGLRRTSSLPDRLGRSQSAGADSNGQVVAKRDEAIFPHQEKVEEKHQLSRTAAVVLLMISTALVALCAEYLVSSIQFMVDNTPIGETFIGLILLPIIGNAAEHFTAVTVATKNKMDLAIGVAVGSSIQIALFVTPIVVLLGWILDVDMSLYFSLFETMTLFGSAFIVNFLVLDGRSNYLEGSLLIAAYVIIAVAAFFYPDEAHQSNLGGGLG